MKTKQLMKQNIVVNPKYAQLAPFVGDVARGTADLGEEIYRARNVVSHTRQCGLDLIVKSFRVPRLLNAFVYAHLRHSKARRSYDNALRLMSLGIGTAVPVAYVEIFSHGLLTRSYFISLKVSGSEMRFWEKRPDSDLLLHKFAAFMIELRDKGVFHKDFSPGNVILDDQYHFYLLDVNRMKFGVRNKERFIDNFARLHTEASEIARLARIYAETDGNPHPEAFAELAVEHFHAFWNGKKRRHELEHKLHLRK
ncbi:MAG: AarF/UbiB family protein [Sodaliphilus sp.]|nr:AarF/UbiB family protein [Sodaliphilus sp.]